METQRQRLQEWRLAVARLYLTGVTITMPVVLVYWALTRPPPALDAPFAFVALAWLGFAAARLFAPASVQAVTVVALLMVTSLVGPLVLGLSPGPFLVGASGVLLGGVVYGRRVAMVLLALLIMSLVSTGALIAFGEVVTPPPGTTDPSVLSNWGRLALFTALNIGLLLFVMTGLFERMEDAWRATAEAATREKQEHEQRRVAEERAMAAQRLEALGKLAGGVAHDFNNLLLVIMAWADMLPAARTDAERKEGLDAIRTAAGQAAQLTRQLVSFARKGVVQPGPVDVDAFIFTMLKSLRRLVADDVKIEYVPAKWPHALVDEAELGQVILNLVVNAGDAMPKGGTLTLNTALLEPPEIPADAPDHNARYVAITVADTGVGMDQQTLARVFDPFFTTKGPGRGTGLGLASAYGIVTQARGFIRAESQLGVGSRFTIGLPVAPDTRAADAAQPRSAAAADRVTGRVLLVEDNAQVRATMATALRHAGFDPIEAGTAAEALQAARRHRGEIDVLCTDAVMPGLPTHDLIEAFRQLFPRAPVLVCSGYIEEELIRRGIEQGSVAVLPKPFTAEALVAKVSALLRS